MSIRSHWKGGLWSWEAWKHRKTFGSNSSSASGNAGDHDHAGANSLRSETSPDLLDV